MKKSGFTLIELLVTIGISGILLTVVFASFGSFNKSKQLSEAADGLVTNLRATATKAVSGDKPVDCTDQLEGYLVILGPAAGYSVQASCLTSSPPATDYTLSNGAEFDSATSFTFYPLDEGVSNGLDINVTIDDLVLTVKVATTGAVYVEAE